MGHEPRAGQLHEDRRLRGRCHHPGERGRGRRTPSGGCSHNDVATHVGSDLIRGQILNGIFTTTLKFAANRTRPTGSAYSFPSGHASATFTSAACTPGAFRMESGRGRLWRGRLRRLVAAPRQPALAERRRLRQRARHHGRSHGDDGPSSSEGADRSRAHLEHDGYLGVLGAGATVRVRMVPGVPRFGVPRFEGSRGSAVRVRSTACGEPEPRNSGTLEPRHLGTPEPRQL